MQFGGGPFGIHNCSDEECKSETGNTYGLYRLHMSSFKIIIDKLCVFVVEYGFS